MINFTSIPEFDKDFKKLAKRYVTLESDFEIMKRATIEALYELGVDNRSIIPIEGYCCDCYTANKIRKFSCKALKGRGSASGIRVIFVWEEKIRTVTFIEIYFKADQENEDRSRLQKFIIENFGKGNNEAE